jgi:hypothetical protein
MEKNNFTKEQKEACNIVIEEMVDYLYRTLPEVPDTYFDDLTKDMKHYINDEEYEHFQPFI